jgi:hypothetical protein
MSKFNAKKTDVDGVVFDSKKEASYYIKLKALRKAKNEAERVSYIELQPKFDIIIDDKKLGFYKADFRVGYADGRTEVVDIKGYKKGAAYQLFRLKKKVIEALYNINIIEK